MVPTCTSGATHLHPWGVPTCTSGGYLPAPVGTTHTSVHGVDAVLN